MGLFWMVDGIVQKDRPIYVPQSQSPKFHTDDGVRAEQPRYSGRRESDEQVRVTQVMSRNLVTLTENHTVDDALNVVEDFGFHHVPIIDADGQLAGIVSDRDLFQALDFGEDALREHMTRKVLVIRPSTFLKDAARLLMTEKISSLPVVNARLELVGLVTMAAVLGYLVSHPAMKLWS